jgi:gas vesicle protein
MKTVWGILTVVAVGIITALLFMYGTRSGRFEEDVKARINTLRETEEAKAALKKIDEIQAKISATLKKLGEAIQEWALDLKKDIDPQIAKLARDVEELTSKLNVELNALHKKAQAKSEELRGSMAKLSREAREKAVKGYETLQDEIDKLETSIALGMIAAKAAAKKGADEFEAQKAKLEEYAKKVQSLQETVTVEK